MSDKKEGRTFTDIMSYWNVKDTSKQQQQPQQQTNNDNNNNNNNNVEQVEEQVVEQIDNVVESPSNDNEQQQQEQVQQEGLIESIQSKPTNWANISIASTNPYSTVLSNMIVGEDDSSTSTTNTTAIDSSGYDQPQSVSSYSNSYNNNSSSSSSYNQSVYSIGSYGQKSDTSTSSYNSSYNDNNNNNNSNSYDSSYGYSNDQLESKPKTSSDTPKTSLFDSIDKNQETSSSTPSINQKGNSWNEKFQELLEEKDSEEKFKKLSTIANEFVYCANTYGKIIISERNLENDQKTILPIDIGGVAGGSKFRVMDIIFKFVVDTEIAEGVWMYGDHCKSDEMAQKSAGHELKGLNHYMEHAMMNGGGLIRFPLMAIIDYRGYRLLAISSLPLDKKTIVYGSCDGGRTVHDSDPLINEEMKRIASILNIKGHYVGLHQPPTFLYGPGDIEVHKGFDGRYYMIDFARCFPPEYPNTIKGKMGREIFYSMLRPELISLSTDALSPDAFSGWQSGKDEQESNDQVIAMTERLHNLIIPECVEYIQSTLDNSDQKASDQLFFESTHLAKDIRSTTSDLGEWEKEQYEQKNNDVLRMINEIHSKGINIRYLGIACQKISQRSLRSTFMTEVVARTFKKIIRARFREKLENSNRPSDEPRQIVAQIFDILLNRDRHDEFKDFWSNLNFGTFKFTLLKVFPNSLNNLELLEDYDMRNSFDMKFLIIRLIYILNIRINPVAYSQFLNSKKYVISLRDIEDVDSTIKYPTIIDVAAGDSLIYEVQRLLVNHKVPPLQAQRWIDLAQHKLKTAQKSIPLSGSLTVKLASTYLLKANSTGSIKDSLSFLRIGSQLIEQASSHSQESNSELLAVWGMIHLKLATHYLFYGLDYQRFKQELDLAQERLEKALSINSSSVEGYLYQSLPFEYNEKDSDDDGVKSFILKYNHSNSYNTGVEQRKLYELLSMVMLIDQCPPDSTLHTFIKLAMGQVREISQLEIPFSLARIIDTETVGQLFENLPNILILSAKKITFNPTLANSTVSMKFLTTLELTDCYFTDNTRNTPKGSEPIPDGLIDPYHPITSMSDLLREILLQCKMLHSLTISARATDDKSFEGIGHLFGQLKQLSICQGYITNKTLLDLSPHLDNLVSLSLSYTNDVNDNGVVPLLQSLSSRPIKLKELYLSLHGLTDETGKQIVKMASELEVLMLIRTRFTAPVLTEILSNLRIVKLLDLSSTSADSSSIEALEQTSQSIVSLYLDQTNCGDDQTVQALSNFASPSLKALHLPRFKGDGQLLWSYLRKLPNLEHLRLPPSSHLPYLIKVHKELIDNNETIAESPLSKVKWLDLTMCTVGYESLQEFMCLTPLVECLSLSAVTYIHTDRCIVVEFNDNILNQYLKLFTNLYELNISNHKTLEKRHIATIISHCQIIRRISCYGCEKITSQIAYDLSQEYPHIRIDH
ncbi:hypothetical protein DFA_12244 [Cavenderia fasciculata]|uniref:Clu domain-containing protein n=1 Tax=Cavenderia fasciculata TaxID=261658 RepID=F4QCU8_CACFS|nr:uncharacterized protein DFA_12244 [Cavenderia fasciculata]EGG14472.1 hypothetical protein DFA_12244 [Cavenderia fasciculata]|eukprot:XP_004353881.1 hypothetical protein DFA_12244 [Cavenderia fasciculata]